MKEILRILRRRKLLFAVPFVVVFLLPSLFSLLFMRGYKADALIWLDESVTLAPVLRQEASGDGGTPIQRASDTLNQLLQSRAFLMEVIGKTGLGKNIRTRADREGAIGRLKRNLGSTPVGRNSVRITYYGSSPYLAADVVRAGSDVFLAWIRRSVDDRNNRTLDLLAREVAVRRKGVDESRRALQKLKERHPETEQLEQRKLVLALVRVSALPAVQMAFERLQKEYEYSLKLYEDSLDNQARARIMAAAEHERYQTGLRLLDPPEAPTSFAKNRLLMTMALAFLAALVSSILAVSVAEANDETLHSEKDVEDKLDLHVLATLPEHAGTSDGGHRASGETK